MQAKERDRKIEYIIDISGAGMAFIRDQDISGVGSVGLVHRAPTCTPAFCISN